MGTLTLFGPFSALFGVQIRSTAASTTGSTFSLPAPAPAPQADPAQLEEPMNDNAGC
jgi:hypothetical protein